MRFKSVALMLVCVLALKAQVEPNLQTTTDLSDVYQSKGGSTKLVLILDSTAASRGVFETFDYLTNKARRAFLGAHNSQGGNPMPSDVSSDTVFAEPGRSANNKGYPLNRTNPILGYVFGMRRSATTSDAEVRMYTWPSGSPVTVRTAIGSTTEVVGYPYAYSGSGTAMSKVSWNADALSTLKNGGGNPVTHLRFTVNGRTIDLPCPWKVFDSPSFVTQPTAPTTTTPFPAIQPYQRNFQRNQTYQTGHSGIPYDGYSDVDAHATRVISGYDDTVLGQFYYSPDYLAWIFYGKSIRGTYALTGNSAGTITWLANSYGYVGGFAVPATTDTVSVGANGSTSGKGEGFANHLPVLTRIQAQKMAVINAYVDKWGKGSWFYRFLAPGYGDATNDEELTASAYATPSVYRADRSDADTNPSYLSDIRALTGTLLSAGTSALQNIGPRDVSGTQSTAMSDFGSNVAPFDAFTPEPLAVALANTYRKIVRDTTRFSSGDCGGGVVVVPLAATPMNDSKTTLGDQLAAYNGNSAGYYSYTHGNSGLSKGGSNYPHSSITSAMVGGTFLPGSDYFHPAVMSASAAFGLTGVTNYSGVYDAPWNDPSTMKGFSIQTMCVSLAVPGTYVLASDNNGRNPHEEFFDVAQWGNPSNKAWSASNPAPSADLIYYYQPTNSANVRYFPSADPATLEQAVASIASYLVYGKAALSAPATPATGVQNANQAYFGTFQTTATTDASARVPVWAGNLYSIGLQRTTVPGSTTGSVVNIIRYYGIDDSTGSFSYVNNTGTNTADFDVLNLWSAFTIFGNYQNVTVNTNKILGGQPLSWKSRRAYLTNSSNDLELYAHSDDISSGNGSNTTQLGRIRSWIMSMDPTGRYYLSQTVRGTSSPVATGTPATPSYNDVRDLMRFLLGAFDPAANSDLRNRDKTDTNSSGSTLGHLNIMGDIVNSAPLAIELSKDMADTLPSVVTGDAFYTMAYGSTYSDPHTRLIMVGTNTGNLHCFVEVAAKSSSGYYMAKAYELWTFLPPNLFPMLWDIYNQRTQTDTTVYKHHYGVDGDPMLYHNDLPPSGSVTGDTRVSVGENAAIVFGFRKGARDYFALKLSDSTDSSVLPSNPHLAWWVKPVTGEVVTPAASSTSFSGLIKTMGMSTCVPAIGYVTDSSSAFRHVVFLSGGYANDEVNARYLNDDAFAGTTYFQNGMGRLILALDPMNGAHVRTTPWDFRSLSVSGKQVGAIVGGVIPVEVINQGTGLDHRLYFGDTSGGVWAINNASTTSAGFRQDSAAINAWSATPRLIYTDSNERFTASPDAFRLSGGFPVRVAVGTTAVNPLTVMVAIGSGDRNNPIDASEDYSYTDKSGVVHSVAKAPPAYNRFYVFADLQNSTTPITALTLLDSSWATSYSDARVTAGSSTYLWGTFDSASNSGSGYTYGYYLDLPHDPTSATQAPAGNSTNTTRDKVLISPLIKQSALFYSLYNVYGSSGYGCSPYSTTRTFRECDIVRPLWIDPQVDINSSKVGDISGGTGSKSSDGCSGLAFTFNSLSSQLVDAGDYVMQGGAKASTSAGIQGANTPDIQAVKDTSSNRGFRIRSWRVIR